MQGFGVAAWNHAGQLYVSGSDGLVYRLNDADDQWEQVATLAQPRFFHRLVALPFSGLFAVGGASASGHLSDAESIEPTRSSNYEPVIR
jgi:hypothetical protein